MEPPLCPAFKVTRDEMKEQSFLAFVKDTFRRHPNLPAFKIVPPTGWSPTQTDMELDGMVIATPIQQLAFGKTGSYRCVLVEQKVWCSNMTCLPDTRPFVTNARATALTVQEFRDLATTEDRLPPKKCRSDIKEMERSFWKSVTINPPLYGADTPISLFKQNCNGWGLSDIGDLLKEKNVPDIPGVTTPMTYFGMWKSFFAWHVEDADLYSVNFLHWGAPKVWYCVSPEHKARFERLAGALHPDQLQQCKGFLRHKDILISPTLLRQYGVKYQMCKQEPGEFVVLNAAAYHSGFNCGFNTAEAVNFATEDWIEAGRQAIPCTCRALKDRVNIDMAMFDDSAMSMNTSSEQTEADTEASSAEDGDADRSEDAASPPPRERSADPSQREAPASKRARDIGSQATSKVPRGQNSACQARAGRQSSTSRAAAKPLRAAAMKLSAARKMHGRNEAVLAELGKLPKPFAIVYGDATETTDKQFDLVVPLEKPASAKTKVMLQTLKQGRDGLYRPCSDVFEERSSSLIAIRTQLVDPTSRKPGFKLLTLKSRILGTELVG